MARKNGLVSLSVRWLARICDFLVPEISWKHGQSFISIHSTPKSNFLTIPRLASHSLLVRMRKNSELARQPSELGWELGTCNTRQNLHDLTQKQFKFSTNEHSEQEYDRIHNELNRVATQLWWESQIRFSKCSKFLVSSCWWCQKWYEFRAQLSYVPWIAVNMICRTPCICIFVESWVHQCETTKISSGWRLNVKLKLHSEKRHHMLRQKGIHSQSMWRETTKSRVSTYPGWIFGCLGWASRQNSRNGPKIQPLSHDVLVLTSWSIPDNKE